MLLYACVYLWGIAYHGRRLASHRVHKPEGLYFHSQTSPLESVCVCAYISERTSIISYEFTTNSSKSSIITIAVIDSTLIHTVSI